MKRIGEVTAVKGEALEITFCRPADCGKCHACIGGKPTTVLELKGSAQVGDSAVVELPDSMVRKASLLAYILPLGGLLGGAVLGSLMASGDTGAAVGGVAGLAAALLGVFIGEKKRRGDSAWAPQLIEIWPKDTMPKAVKEDAAL